MRYLFLNLFLLIHLFSDAQVFNGTGGLIPDGQLAWSQYQLNVTGVGVIDCNFRLCVDISHNWVDDIDFRLIPPNGINHPNGIRISTDNGGSGDDYSNTCFTMDATTSIVNGNPPFEGDYLPQGNNNNNYGIENFDNLIGESANGIWRLLIRDDAWLFSGSLNSWSLDFTCDDDCNGVEEEYTLNLIDSYGDGWYAGFGNGTHTVEVNDVSYGEDFSNNSINNVGLDEISYTLCLDPTDCIDISFIDGGLWENECSFNLVNSSGVTVFNGNYQTNDQTIGDCPIEGCTDPVACNFDPDADDDDGSCFYTPLTVDECEVVYCDSESGEQLASQYLGTNVNYLTIEITESGIINELFYDINWHSHGWGNINFSVNNATIALYDNFGAFVQNIAVIGNNLSISTYQNFINTINTDINVYAGYSIQVFINSPNWGGGTWESYVNEAIISFTVITESVNAGNDVTLDLCYDDLAVNLFSFLGQDVDVNGTWSPQLTGGYLGTFNPEINTPGMYTYTIQDGDCIDEAFVDVGITTIDVPQITSSEDFICFGSSSLVTYSVLANQGSNYSWSVNGGVIAGSSTTNSIQVDLSTAPLGTISNAVVLSESVNGCINSSSLDATIIANPIPSLNIDNTEICLGESVTVTVNQTYNNYVWTPAELLNSNIYTPNSSSDNQISVTITSEEGCSTTENIDFTIYENPIVNLSAEVSEICFTDSLTLTSNPGYNYYSWTPSTITGNADVYYPSTSSEDMIFLTVTGEGGSNDYCLSLKKHNYSF